MRDNYCCSWNYRVNTYDDFIYKGDVSRLEKIEPYIHSPDEVYFIAVMDDENNIEGFIANEHSHRDNQIRGYIGKMSARSALNYYKLYFPDKKLEVMWVKEMVITKFYYKDGSEVKREPHPMFKKLKEKSDNVTDIIEEELERFRREGRYLKDKENKEVD